MFVSELSRCIQGALYVETFRTFALKHLKADKSYLIFCVIEFVSSTQITKGVIAAQVVSNSSLKAGLLEIQAEK